MTGLAAAVFGFARVATAVVRSTTVASFGIADVGHGHGVEIGRAEVELTEVAEAHGQVNGGLRTDLT